MSTCAVRWQKSQGAIVRKKNQPMVPEDVRDNWGKITDFTDAEIPTSIQGLYNLLTVHIK